MSPKIATLLLLAMMLMVASATLASSMPESTLSACELLKIKRDEWADVKRALRESSLLIQGMEEMKLNKGDFSETMLAEENGLAQNSLKEGQRLDKVLNLHVTCLELLCKKDPASSNESGMSSAIKTSATSGGSIQMVNSAVEYLPTKKPSTTPSDSPSKPAVVAEAEVFVDEPGVDVIDNAIIAGGGLSSCLEYKKNIKTTLKSGKYWINTGTDKFIVYCWMEPREGGDTLSAWTLISSRSALYEPVVVDSVVMNKSYKGETIKNSRFEFLKKNANSILLINANNQTAIAQFSNIPKGNCVPFGDISKRSIFHQESRGCDLIGNDYCFIGLNKPGGSAQIETRYCNYFRSTFNYKEVNKELDIYVR